MQLIGGERGCDLGICSSDTQVRTQLERGAPPGRLRLGRNPRCAGETVLAVLQVLPQRHWGVKKSL